tara:strand:+ start:898 stop:1098 length:201 start_codon:yes stop_codon:yes gene_type:complete
MTRAEKLQEIKELTNHQISVGRTIDHFNLRIEWLQNNLDAKTSKEERQMSSENKSTKSQKTLSFEL